MKIFSNNLFEIFFKFFFLNSFQLNRQTSKHQLAPQTISPINGGLAAKIGSSREKYISNIQITIQARPFSNSFSPACGGNQKLTNVIRTTTIAGVTAIALNIGDWRWKTMLKAVKSFWLNLIERLGNYWRRSVHTYVDIRIGTARVKLLMALSWRWQNLPLGIIHVMF